MKKFLFIILLIIVVIFLYGKYIEPSRLKIKEHTIYSDKISNAFTELKIVHFSDILYNNNKDVLNKLKNKINELNADIIFFTGDLFHKGYKYNDEDKNNLKEFLKELNVSLYKYSVVGENDLEFIDDYKDIMYEGDFKLLDNESSLLFYKDQLPINIIGISSIETLEELLKSDIEYSYSIIMSHYPDYFEKIKKLDVDLVLSGHSLGGIIQIPFYGGIIKKENANNYLNNYYEENNIKLFISNGIGYDNYEFRLFNSPSINVYRFKNK